MKKKKIYLYSNFLKISIIISIIFIDYLIVLGIFNEGMTFENFLILIIMTVFTIFVFFHIYSHYIFIDTNKNIIFVSLSISKKNKIMKPMSSIKDIFLETKDNGFQVVLVHKFGEYQEKVFYRYNRFNFIEKTQLKRISKEITIIRKYIY